MNQREQTTNTNWLSINVPAIRWGLIVAIIVIMLFHLLMLTKYPLPFIDEGWMANASWTWLTTGENFDAFHTGTLDQFENPWVWRYYLGQLPFVLSYSTFGLGFFQTRLVSWVFGATLLLATAGVARRLYRPVTGWIAALLLSLSYIFILASRWRQDIMLATVIMVAFWLLLKALDEDKGWAHFTAALLLTLGLDIHQSAVFFIPAWAILYIVAYGKRVFVKRGAWFAALGGALGIAYYVALHILPAPETFSTLMSFQTAGDGGASFPFLEPTSLIHSFLDEVRRYFRASNPEEFVIVATGFLFLALRRRQNDYRLLIFVAVVAATFTLLSGHKWDLYAIYLFPFMLIPAAEMLVSLLNGEVSDTYQRYGRILAGLLLAAFVVVKAMWFGQIATDHHTHDFYEITSQMRSVIEEDQRVIGMPTWWLGFTDMDYRSFYNISFHRFFDQYTVEEALREIQPDYIIVDELWRYQLASGPGEKPLIGNNWLPQDEFWAVVDEYGELALEFNSQWYRDPFHVYEMDWSS